MAQLRPLLAPALFDAVATFTRARHRARAPPSCDGCDLQPATVVDGEATAAEVFATYSRGRRVRAIAGRVELVNGRWMIVALQIG